VALFAAFFPTGAALIQGQDSVIFLTLFATAFVALSRGENFAAGLVAGLGLFKFQIAIPIAVLFLFWRQWRFFAGFCCSGATLACLSVWLTGSAQLLLYVRSLLSLGTGANVFRYHLPLQMMANIHGLVFGLAGGVIPSKTQLIVTMILSSVSFAGTAFVGRRIERPATLLLCAMPCAVLISYYAFIHDLSILIVPVAMSFIGLRHFGSLSIANKLQIWSAAVVLALPIIQVFWPNYVFLVAIAITFLLATISGAVLPASSRSSEPIAQ
jgi:hypothetical protein